MSRLGIGGVTMNHSPGGFAIWKWSKYQVGPDHMRFMEEEVRPSEKALHEAWAACVTKSHEWQTSQEQTQRMLEAAYTIDVAPLEARIEELEADLIYEKKWQKCWEGKAVKAEAKITEQAEEIERLKKQVRGE